MNNHYGHHDPRCRRQLIRVGLAAIFLAGVTTYAQPSFDEPYDDIGKPVYFWKNNEWMRYDASQPRNPWIGPESGLPALGGPQAGLPALGGPLYYWKAGAWRYWQGGQWRDYRQLESHRTTRAASGQTDTEIGRPTIGIGRPATGIGHPDTAWVKPGTPEAPTEGGVNAPPPQPLQPVAPVGGSRGSGGKGK
jgi:hypothetical protein